MTTPPPPEVFVRAILSALKLDPEKPSEVARALDLVENYYGPDRVRRWLKGSNGPSYEPMMEMLIKAGWLTDEAWTYLRAAAAQAQRAEEQARKLAPEPPAPKRKANG